MPIFEGMLSNAPLPVNYCIFELKMFGRVSQLASSCARIAFSGFSFRHDKQTGHNG
ncbi:hypothetical protein ACFQUU_00995 [Herbaspirillum sp. GCM10030257]|uniref:hypothetical protein n=1 Tax=Herbaspirillum sp. GCM10030257 TaxID=3273393 RepID=UPI0036175561